MVSPNERVTTFKAFAAQFNAYLIGSPGIALKAQLRCAIAHEARNALVNCNSCAGLPPGACLRPGVAVYSVLDMDHTQGDAMNTVSGVSDDTKKVLTNLVHSVINHQGRLDGTWYESTCEKINSTQALPDSIQGDKRRHLAHSLMMEAACISIISHAINITFLGIEGEAPRLPSLQETEEGDAAKGGPTYLDWSILLKKEPTRNKKFCFTPFIRKRDIDASSSEYNKIPDHVWELLLSWSMLGSPFLGMSMAGGTLFWAEEMTRIFYMEPSKIAMPVSTELDPDKYCADSFSRFDSELVAHEVAKTHQCTF